MGSCWARRDGDVPGDKLDEDDDDDDEDVESERRRPAAPPPAAVDEPDAVGSASCSARYVAALDGHSMSSVRSDWVMLKHWMSLSEMGVSRTSSVCARKTHKELA